MLRPLLSLVSLLATLSTAEITIYGPQGQTTLGPPGSVSTVNTQTSTTTSFVTTAGPPQYTGLAAYNPIYMLPPDPPPLDGMPQMSIPNSAQLQNALSIPQQPTFLGFSIEMSVATQLSECPDIRYYILGAS